MGEGRAVLDVQRQPTVRGSAFIGIAVACFCLQVAGSPDRAAMPSAAASAAASRPSGSVVSAKHRHGRALGKRRPQFDVCKRRCALRDSFSCCTATAETAAVENADRH
jgi:hypothetical protein